jgi:hypothetical protein
MSIAVESEGYKTLAGRLLSLGSCLTAAGDFLLCEIVSSEPSFRISLDFLSLLPP